MIRKLLVFILFCVSSLFSQDDCEQDIRVERYMEGYWKSDSLLFTSKIQLERMSDRPHGVFTLILKKFPEGWRIVHDHTSASNSK